MRFKRGCKVEVFCRKEVPSGSWRRAEIICRKGHYFTVKYDEDVGACGEVMLYQVPGEAVRPCPPPIEMPEIWVSGDIVEVYHNFSWKLATVISVLPKVRYLVKLLGSSQEFKVCKYYVRMRLCWQDGCWLMIGKASSVPHRLRETSVQMAVRRHLKDASCTSRNIGSIQESYSLPSAPLEKQFRSRELVIDLYADRSERVTVNDKETSWLPSQQKEDAVVSLPKRQKTDGAVPLESRDADTDSSSVGSCSAPQDSLFEDDDCHCSDAESFVGRDPDKEMKYLEGGVDRRNS
ncbi:hypothetical protein Nepgr_022381 [Nepenthes gracilis]|uniref:Agenet domain-containing protein n=1 Tax=Nepenthes gracilis TaxID=150966 RepID=A0AAD3SZF2_NEPGR|nr:hypothetical protein Nepgr_022381 [Nepenthes gracilis]